jgi:hypothetical protein
MQTNPAARCQHVKAAGVQCGSPALRNIKYCYYHQQGRSQAIEYYSEVPYTAIETDLPLFEDAYSIQLSIRQVVHMLMHDIIDSKKAGLLLYSLQIASANLKQMKAETPQPAQIVVDLDQLAETPLETAPAPNQQPESSSAVPQNATRPKRKRNKPGEQSEEEIQAELNYLLTLGRHLDAPYGTVPEVEQARRAAELSHKKREAEDDGLPPGTIQACARSQYVN